VVRVVLLFYLMPAWTVVLAWPILGERPTPASAARLAVAMAGVLIVLKGPGASLPVPQSLPDWLALAGGFSFALTNVLLRRLSHAPAPARILAMFAGGAATAAAAAMWGVRQGVVMALPAPEAGWLAVGLLLSVGFLAGNTALQYGAARLDAQSASLIMLSEVVFASFSSVWAGASRLDARTWLGGGLILAAAAWAAWAGRGQESGANAQ
jgi:drug/metabolite transporter (DMT)-like permease